MGEASRPTVMNRWHQYYEICTEAYFRIREQTQVHELSLMAGNPYGIHCTEVRIYMYIYKILHSDTNKHHNSDLV